MVDPIELMITAVFSGMETAIGIYLSNRFLIPGIQKREADIKKLKEDLDKMRKNGVA